MSGTALLCLMVFCNTFSIGGFNPLLPEIGRRQGLADWELGLLAGTFGFARMCGAIPSGWLAGRRLAVALGLSPAFLALGLALVASAGPFPVLIAGRFCMGLGHTLGTVSALTAILLDDRGANASVRLNTFEFAGMAGILAAVALVGSLPATWAWNASFAVTASPLLAVVLLLPAMRRHFGHVALDAPAAAAPTATLAVRRAEARPVPPIVVAMFVVGILLALTWSSVSQFLLPLRGTREFGLSRGGLAWLFAVAQVVDLLALLPVGRCADRLGRVVVLGVVTAVMGLGTVAVGLGGLPLFVAGCAAFGFGLAGWMLPLGVIREHTSRARLGWRTGCYRVGVDASVFLGPLVSGLLGARGAAVFVAAVGVLALAAGVALLMRPALLVRPPVLAPREP